MGEPRAFEAPEAEAGDRRDVSQEDGQKEAAQTLFAEDETAELRRAWDGSRSPSSTNRAARSKRLTTWSPRR